jgi:hypothetical protein
VKSQSENASAGSASTQSSSAPSGATATNSGQSKAENKRDSGAKT